MTRPDRNELNSTRPGGTGPASAGPASTGSGSADLPASTPLAVAPHVALTPLPFGGAVLVNGATLRLLECADRDTPILSRLLATGVPPAADRPAARMARDLLAAGWLVPVPVPAPAPAEGDGR